MIRVRQAALNSVLLHLPNGIIALALAPFLSATSGSHSQFLLAKESVFNSPPGAPVLQAQAPPFPIAQGLLLPS